MKSHSPVSADDYLAIQRFLGGAADAVTRRDFDKFASCWAQDGVWNVGLNRGSFEGRASIVENMRTIMAGIEAIVQTVENGDAWYAEGGTDVVHSRFYVTELVRRPSGETMLLRFFYADRLVRDGVGWLFSERVLNPLYVGPYDLSGPFQSATAQYADL
ncbi:nuclear transport factor 2 family protein [Nocardia rhamnosiphila]|uniref:Nuclear transport factor 2 family protein n=1 Tax=Nocardia rhamnosiphila TaxID=426716 RepID=A0ABV2WYS5_9NOCA